MVGKIQKILMVGLFSVTSSAYSMETLIDFEGQEESYGISELVIQNVTFSTDAIDGFLVMDHFDFFSEQGFYEEPLSLEVTFQNNVLILDDGRQPLRFDFESSVSNFSFNMLGTTGSGDWQLEVFSDLGELMGSTLESSSFRADNGFSSSSENISYATLTNVSGLDSSTVLIDNFRYTEVSPVPEPSTYALMLGGLGLVGFMAYRRKKVLS